jgi:hypothetical protein
MAFIDISWNFVMYFVHVYTVMLMTVDAGKIVEVATDMTVCARIPRFTVRS